MKMNIKEAIDVLERNCDFHYDETGKCYGCLFENSGWCSDDFHESLLALLKEQGAEIERLKRPDCEHAERDGAGCLGYCGCEQDDEPIESCKRCEKYTGNVYEAVKWNA